MNTLNPLIQKSLENYLSTFLEEDDLSRNFSYIQKLPSQTVSCSLKIKDDVVLAGLPLFFEVFNFLLTQKLDWEEYLELEGQKFFKNENKEIHFELPFNIALTGERLALNLLQRASAIATFTNRFVETAKESNIKILDTRKTTPGLRWLEKYAVTVGGGYNHRLGQTDLWMIKDNHKSFFGGVKEALDFFKSVGSFYNPIVLEVHSLDELSEAIELNIKHVMLDNFSPDDIKKAVTMKPKQMTYEVSGGIRMQNIEQYLIKGVDCISIGALTYDAPHVDLSLKYQRKI